jgi:serine/threonine protein kinase
MPLAPGTRLGPYEITGLLGEGGMGEVYRAHDTKLDRAIALKILPDAFARDPDRLARFEREARTLASLNHPNVAQVYDADRISGAAYLAMELVEGEDLSALIARGPVPSADVLPIAKQIALGLEAAHEVGIIHRDLKPANVMFREDGTIALVDFGSARRDADPVAKTLAGVVIGTPYYLSPEQALGGTADERSDLYSVGVMLYELLTGQRMYAAATLVGLFEMHKKAPIPKLPEPFTRHQPFLERLVAKSPELRYPSAAEAFNGLMEYMMSDAGAPATA